MSTPAPKASAPLSPDDAALLSALKAVDDVVKKQKENEKSKDPAITKEAKAKDLSVALGDALTLLRAAADVDAASAELRAKAYLSLAIRWQSDDSRREEVNALLDFHRSLVPPSQLKMLYFVARLMTFKRLPSQMIEQMSPEYIQTARDLVACIDPDANEVNKKWALLLTDQLQKMDKSNAKKRADELRALKQAAQAKAAEEAAQRASTLPLRAETGATPAISSTTPDAASLTSPSDVVTEDSAEASAAKKKKKKKKKAAEDDPAGASSLGADQSLLAPHANLVDADVAGARDDEVLPLPRASELRNERYVLDVRQQRFDVGRMLATPRAGSLQFALPRVWWDRWCAYVGGFSDAEVAVLRDLHARAGPGAVLQCTDPRVVAAFAPFPFALPSDPRVADTWTPTAAPPGRIETAAAPLPEALLCADHIATPKPAAEVAGGSAEMTASDAFSDGDGRQLYEDCVAPASTHVRTTPLSSSSLVLEESRAFQICTRCGAHEPGVSKCSSCKLAQYCTERCQKADWPQHRPECKAKQAPPADRRSGRVGINNMGNTCYMGAALQALSSVWPLSKFYVSDEHVPVVDACRHNKLGTKGAMSDAYAELLKGLWYPEKGVRSIFPTKMKTQAANFQSRFSGLAQHDAQELLSFVMDGLHEDCNRAATGSPPEPLRDQLPGESDLAYGRESWRQYTSVNASRIVDLFAGQYKSTLRCPTCATRSVKFDVFNIVPLPMPEAAFRFLPVVLRRLPPGLQSADAFAVPTADASERVKAVWDEIAAFDNHYTRIVLRINMRGRPYVTGADVVAALALEAGVPANCINLFSTSPNMAIKDLVSSSMIINLQSFGSFPPSGDDAARGSSPLLHLFATECTPPSWRSPFTAPDAVNEGAYQEAVALANRAPAKQLDALKAAVIALRPPSWRISCYVECYEPIFHAPDLPRAPIKSEKDKNSIPLCISVSLDTPHAVLRMHVAAALLPVAAPKRAALASALGCAPGARGHEVLCALAASLDFYGEGKVSLDSFSPTTGVAADAPTCLTKITKGIAFSAFGSAAKGPAIDPDLSFLRVKLSLRSHVSFVNLDDFAAVIADSSSVGEAAASPMHTPSNITTCFQQLFAEDEGLDAENMWKCPRCQVPVRATKDMEIWTLPEFLITMFKRFKAGSGYLPRKASQLVDFPLVGLDLTDFNGEAKAAALPAVPSPSLYDAIAVVNHTGQLRGGHYTASINLTASKEGARGEKGAWFSFDDSTVSKEEESRVVTESAYMIVYARRKHDSESKAK